MFVGFFSMEIEQ